MLRRDPKMDILNSLESLKYLISNKKLDSETEWLLMLQNEIGFTKQTNSCFISIPTTPIAIPDGNRCYSK